MKKKIIDMIKTNQYFIVFTIILGLFIIQYNYVPGDDIKFKNEVLSLGTFNFIVNDYLNWSGRLSSTTAFALFLPHINAWKIANTAVAFLFLKGLSHYYSPYLSKENKLKIDKFMLICFFFINIYTVLSSYVWLSGSFQYIWPVTAFIYAMFPFYKILFISEKLNFSKFNWLWFYICLFYASYIEQEFLIILVLGFLSVLVIHTRKGIDFKEKIKIYMYFIFFIINFTIARLTPGLSNRVKIAVGVYPNWENMPFSYRFYEALTLTNKHLISKSNLLFFVFILMLSILMYKKWAGKYKLSYLPLLYIILKIIPFNIFNSSLMLDINSNPVLNISQGLNFYLFDMDKAINNIRISKIEYLPGIITFSIVIFVSFLILIVFEERKKGILNFLIYWAGLFSVYILAFMPAINAIGSRIFFMPATCFLFIISQIYLELKVKYQIDDSNYFKAFVNILALFSFLIILSYQIHLKMSHYF